MGFIDLDNVPAIEPVPGCRMRTPSGEHLMLSYLQMDEGAEVPFHNHPQEQGGILLSGKLQLTIGDETRVVQAGAMFLIPPNVPHRAVAVDGPVTVLDVFSPVREDYAQLTNRYIPTEEHNSLATDDGDDLDLLRRAQTGELAAFKALVERLQPRVYGLARRILAREHDAEDVTQQTFLSVLENLESFREESSVATWVLRISTNHALKVLRKRRGLPTRPLEVPAEADDGYASVPHPEFIAQWRDNPVDLAQRAEVQRLLDEALAELDEKYRLVFVLRDIEELSIKETARTLGLSESNVKVRLLRARLQLRERLTRVLGDEESRVVPDHSHD